MTDKITVDELKNSLLNVLQFATNYYEDSSDVTIIYENLDKILDGQKALEWIAKYETSVTRLETFVKENEAKYGMIDNIIQENNQLKQIKERVQQIAKDNPFNYLSVEDLHSTIQQLLKDDTK